MIKDYKKVRELFCGHGTLRFCPDITKTKEVIYEGDYIKVGEHTDEFNEQNIKQCGVNAIVLNFDGKNAIKSIDILIEDLNKIKKHLESENK